jgi:hypothetical protein
MPPKVTPKKRGLSQTSPSKKVPIQKRREKQVLVSPLQSKEGRTSPRIQTAEGWKREQLRKRA